MLLKISSNLSDRSLALVYAVAVLRKYAGPAFKLGQPEVLQIELNLISKMHLLT
jgi:hypothetical protein